MCPTERFTYTREDLYAAVWSQPLRDACKRFGVSDVGLAKVCKRLNVPRPKQGYWVKREMGQDPPKEALPPAGPDTPAKWEGRRWVEPPTDPTAPPVPVKPIPVPNVIGELHPALKAAMPEMRRASKDIRRHHLWNGRIPILASGATLDRALRIMNALLLALDARGHRYEVMPESAPGEPWRRAQAGVWVCDAFVGLSLFERSNGFLTVRIRGSYEPYREWTDTKTKKIEDRLHEVMPAVLARAEELRLEKIEAERRREEARQAEIRRAEAERLRREQEEMVADLRDTLAAWREARDIRAFIAEARAIVAAGGLEVRPASRLDDFTRWATAQADRIDPHRGIREAVAANVKAGGAPT
jgi:hypothetical protein